MQSDDELDLSQLRLAVEWINVTGALRDGRPLPNASFWETLRSGILATRRTLPRGQTIFRARLMEPEHESDAEPLPPSEMGAPPPERATASRLNAAGEPRFYGAFDRETAIAEMRPWRKARISVAQFSANVDLSVADLTSGGMKVPSDDPIHWLSFMLGRPVHRDDPESYLASQRVAQDCEVAGLNGILYDSALRPGGVNIVLLGVNDLGFVSAELYEVSDLAYTSVRLSP